MISILQRFSALTISVVLLVIATVVFCINLALRSNLHDGVEVSATQLSDTVHIYRNGFGIPHITASTEKDLYFSLGFAHAQDRLWQMDLFRRIARGRTARVFGERTLEADKFFRVLGISSIADKLAANVSRQSRSILDSYCAGINSYIENNRNRLPFEFDALHYAPEPWKPSDCLAIERLMAFDMSMSFWTDIAFGEIADTLGVQEALRFIPSYPSTSPTVCDGGHSQSSADSSKSISLMKLSPMQQEVLNNTAAVMRGVRQSLGMSGMCSGSNCWVMSKRSDNPKSRGLVFANDPHLSLGLPPRWYQVHLSCPQFNAVGYTVAGVPGMIIGRNDNIAWGITNVMLDDCDYFFEKVDPTNRSYYVNADGQRVKFKHIRDTIEVKREDKVDSLIIDYRATSTSAIISDVHATLHNDSLFHYPATKKSLASSYVLSFSWTARELSDEVLCAARLVRCSSWREFGEAVSGWGAPALNFTYADRQGNMGIAPSGLVPIRGEGDANFPHPGWDKSYAWKGVRPGNSLPRIYNPARRFVSSANNMTSRNVGFYLSSLWEPPSRAERIEEMLQEYHEYTVRDAQYMQLDVISRNAKFVLRNTFSLLLRDTAKLDKEEYSALGLLSQWDCGMSPAEVAPAVYTAFHERLMRNVFCYKLSASLYNKYAFVGSMPMRRVNEIISDTSFGWFSNESWKGRQVYESLVLRSFKEAVSLLKERLGNNMQLWTYGRLHTLTLKHPLHDVAAFRSLVSYEVKNIGGDATTLNNALWQVHNPFDVYVGASMRFVCDMEDSVVYSVLPGGSSGQALDAHYTDQVQLWANGGYIPLSMSRKPSSGFTLYATLIPQKTK